MPSAPQLFQRSGRCCFPSDCKLLDNAERQVAEKCRHHGYIRAEAQLQDDIWIGCAHHRRHRQAADDSARGKFPKPRRFHCALICSNQFAMLSLAAHGRTLPRWGILVYAFCWSQFSPEANPLHKDSPQKRCPAVRFLRLVKPAAFFESASPGDE